MSDDLVKRFEHLGKAADLLKSQAAEIARLRAEQGKVRGYLSRLLQSLHPSIEILPDMFGVCTQIDNVLAGQREEITRLRAELATAKRVAKLEGLLGLADSWITAALECKEWRWDADQHEAATHTRDEIREALGGRS